MVKVFVALGLTLALWSCGTDTVKEVAPTTPTPAPGPTPTPTGGYQEVAKILNNSCGGASCHRGEPFLLSEAGLKGEPQVQKRIFNWSMPPDFASSYAAWQDGKDRQKVLDFLSK